MSGKSDEIFPDETFPGEWFHPMNKFPEEWSYPTNVPKVSETQQKGNIFSLFMLLIFEKEKTCHSMGWWQIGQNIRWGKVTKYFASDDFALTKIFPDEIFPDKVWSGNRFAQFLTTQKEAVGQTSKMKQMQQHCINVFMFKNFLIYLEKAFRFIRHLIYPSKKVLFISKRILSVGCKKSLSYGLFALWGKNKRMKRKTKV